MAQPKSFEDMDLPGIATHMRWVLALIGAYIALFAGNIAAAVLVPTSGAIPPAAGMVIGVLYIALAIASVVACVFLMVAMGTRVTSIVAWSFLILIFSFLGLIATYSQASTILKVLGVKSGFFGVSRANRERLMPGRCRRCGYDRAGLDDLLAPCPECNRVPIVW